MITSTRSLKFGHFFVDLNPDHIYTSDKFTCVDKIVCGELFYLLSDGDIYYNDTIDNDNFTMMTTDGIKFINIIELVPSPNIIGLGADYKLYSITGKNIKPIPGGTFCDPIQNIYGASTFNFIIKKKQQYYCIGTADNLNDRIEVNTSIEKVFESIYFTNKKLIVISDNKVLQCNRKLSNFKTIDIDINELRMIPEGSFLMFRDCNSGKFENYPTSNCDDIMCSLRILFKSFLVSYKTGNVYVKNTIIPELHNCSTSTRAQIGSRVKNARFN